MINRTYAILMLGEMLENTESLYRYSDYTPTSDEKHRFKNLVPDNIIKRAIFAEYVIQLLSCSHMWADYTRILDNKNTYDISVDVSETLSDNPLQRIYQWVGSTGVDPKLDECVAVLFSALGYTTEM